MYIILYHVVSYYIILYCIIFNKIRVLEQNWASSKEVEHCQVPVLPKGPDIVFVYVEKVPSLQIWGHPSWQQETQSSVTPPSEMTASQLSLFTSQDVKYIHLFFSTELVAYLHWSSGGSGSFF